MDRENYTRETILEELVEENRKFRQDIMMTTKVLVVCFIIIIIVIEASNCVRTGMYLSNVNNTTTSEMSNVNTNSMKYND